MKKNLLLIPIIISVALTVACANNNKLSQTSNKATILQTISKPTNQSAVPTNTATIEQKPTLTNCPSATITSTPQIQNGMIVNAYKEYTTTQFRKDVDALSEKYGDIIKTESLRKTTKGNDITLIKLGKGDKKTLMVGEVHAREHITSSYLMRIIEEYAIAYTNNTKYGEYDVKKILEENTIYFVPVSNPDGLDIVTNKAMPNVTVIEYDQAWSTWKANGNGVDLNANFPFYWDEIRIKDDRPRSELYRGPSAGSENETQALMTLCTENNFEFMLSFHTQGRVLYWRDDGNGVVPGDEKLANTISNLTNYVKQPSTPVPENEWGGGYAGGFENWFRFACKKPGICIEMVKGGTGTSINKNSDFDSEALINWAKTKYLALEVLVKCV